MPRGKNRKLSGKYKNCEQCPVMMAIAELLAESKRKNKIQADLIKLLEGHDFKIAKLFKNQTEN